MGEEVECGGGLGDEGGLVALQKRGGVALTSPGRVHGAGRPWRRGKPCAAQGATAESAAACKVPAFRVRLSGTYCKPVGQGALVPCGATLGCTR